MPAPRHVTKELVNTTEFVKQHSINGLLSLAGGLGLDPANPFSGSPFSGLGLSMRVVAAATPMLKPMNEVLGFRNSEANQGRYHLASTVDLVIQAFGELSYGLGGLAEKVKYHTVVFTVPTPNCL